MVSAAATSGMNATYQVETLDPDLPYGSIVRGLTVGHLTDGQVRQALQGLWIERGVLVFRDCDSDTGFQVALSKCFGELERHAFPETWVEGHPELVKVKYYPDDGTVYEVSGAARGGWLPWHSDLVYTETINRGGILRPVQLPGRGGLTGFVDQIAAYARLPDTLKTRIEGLHVVYVMDLNFQNHKFRYPADIQFVRGAKSFNKIVGREYQYPRVLHPLVFKQPETGRKVLNVSPAFAVGLYELGGPEGDALLRTVIEHCLADANIYFHDWRQHDLVLWDNWRTLHCATGIEPDDTRVMQRTTISGDYALGRRLDGAIEGLPRVDV